jgi:hypothetical protein
LSRETQVLKLRSWNRGSAGCPGLIPGFFFFFFFFALFRRAEGHGYPLVIIIIRTSKKTVMVGDLAWSDHSPFSTCWSHS